MQQAKIDGATYRNGTWGPGYLLQGSNIALGVVRLGPGDAMDNHLHRTCDETFVVVEGECTLWVDASRAHVMREGDVYTCSPSEMHHLVNESQAPFRCIFIKTPASPGDTVIVPWIPGEPVPAIPAP